MRRAAYSVAANLVEGFASHSIAVRLRYARIARGSLAEVGYGIHLSGRLGYLSDETVNQVQAEAAQAAATLHGLIKYLIQQKKSRPHE
jgi:four helix bundle protein